MTNKDWMHASKEEIENMTYQDMLEIMEDHVEVFRKNPNDGFCNIRPHWMKTLETCIELLKEKLKEEKMTEEMRKDYANINATYGAQALTKEQLYMVGVDALITAKRKELVPDMLDYNKHIPVDEKPCEDAIDRQPLRARFNHLDEVYEGMSEEEKHEAYIYGQIIQAIDDAPPVTLKNQKTMETVLDEIREEIENHCGLAKESRCRYCSYCHNVMGVREILEVIDKYKEGDANEMQAKEN